MLVSRLKMFELSLPTPDSSNFGIRRSKESQMFGNACVLLGAFLVLLGVAVVVLARPISEFSIVPARILGRQKFIANNSHYIDEKPPDKRELGRATWTAFHTLAANFPDEPTEEDKKSATYFVQSLTKLYPCKVCREHFDRFVSVQPPE
jgi:Erv1 / Alr family